MATSPPQSPRRRGGDIALDLGGRRPDPAGAMSPLMTGFWATKVGHLRRPVFFSVGARRRRRRSEGFRVLGQSPRHTWAALPFRLRPLPSHLAVQSNCLLELLVMKCTSKEDILYKCHEKYGGAVRLWLGPNQLLVSIKDTELINEVLTKAEDKLPLTGRAFRLAFGKSSFFVSFLTSYGIRNYLISHLKAHLVLEAPTSIGSIDYGGLDVEHQRKSLELKLGGKLLERARLIPGEIFDCVIDRAQSTTAKGGIDCEMLSQHLAFTILGATIFGDVFLTWPKATLYEELLMKIAKDACFWASYGVAPFWKQEFCKYQDSCTKLKSLTQELIKECRQDSKSDFLLDFDGHDDMRCEPCGEIISLMFHGSLTMASLIANILTRLVTHLDIQDKIHSEIVMAQKTGRRPDQQNVDIMPISWQLYMNQFVFFQLDLYCKDALSGMVIREPAVSVCFIAKAFPMPAQFASLSSAFVRNGMVIPAASIIVVPVQLVQTDCSNWGNDAGQFNPYRFLSRTNGSGRFISNQKELLTVSSGNK
ncbi:hypothetical protein Sango_0649800 [Sesamum angolense]|uniref:Cytochrome P450 n=1 Tax=Sesamum angolense TaxID=2727404 RepID=A0AAE1X6Y3_9LAMI|nr:hypothetical protein Sango_0649800 [Sesamum angolense]